MPCGDSIFYTRNNILSRNSPLSKTREAFVSLYSVLVRLHLERCVQFCPEKGNKAVRGLEHKSYEEQLREMGLFSLEEAKGRPHCSHLKGGCGEVGVGLF